MRLAAFVTLAAFLAFLSACTRQVPRAAPETRHYEVDWDALDRQQVEWEGWRAEGIPLTPRQWPLEASMKSLFAGDFTGVFDRLDLTFHSSTLDEDVLEELFDAGFLPVYARVTNVGNARRVFLPTSLALLADGHTRLYAAHPEELPDRFSELDIGKTVAVVAASAVAVLLIVLSARNNGGAARLGNAGVHIMAEARLPLPEGGGSTPLAAPPASDTRGLLTAGELAPGESAEGFLFFRIDADVLDWATVRLAAP